MEDENKAANKVELGDFPFPLTKGAEESRYLTWLRNHSNYMATRGFLDYFRIVAVLVRGILLNFLIFLSLLLAVSLVVGHLYGPQLRSMPSSADLPLDQLDTLATKLKNKESQFDKWVADRLSQETRAALNAVHDRPKDLQIALAKDLRELIDREPISAKLTEERKKATKDEREKATKKVCEKAAAVKPAAVSEEPGGWRVEWMKTLDKESKSRLRLDNRLLLEHAYPEICELRDPSAGWLFETGLLPPMPLPFTLTSSALLLALFLILFSPIWVIFREIAGHKTSTERAGSDSSVKRRDKFERLFGFLFLSIITLALFEALPVLVDAFHQVRVRPEMNWDAIFASMAGVAVAVVGGASKLLSVLAGMKKKLAMLLIGLLGVLVPLLVILYVTEFLVYAKPYEGWITHVIAALPFIFAALILFIIILGIRTRSFKRKEIHRLIMLVVGLIIVPIFFGLYLWLVIDSGHYEYEWNFYLVLTVAVALWFFCRLFVDINRTSINGLYRDRLASAYLVGLDTKGDVDIEEDINLSEIGCHETGSTAPYHLVNVTLNLQGSKDITLRDRNSDFFIFSKRFIGGRRSGYCRTETLEQVHPQMSLATAMAISAAAASPNMGRGTNPAFVALMVLLNIRLGYWLPNPGLLEEKLFGRWITKIRGEPKATKKTPPGFTFDEVFEQELVEITGRRENAHRSGSGERKLLMTRDEKLITTPTTEHGLVGLGLSGGGIRSATINLGIVQVLHERGVFDHVDYLSTVSGGGYLGASISTLMRRRTKSNFLIYRSEINGVVNLDTTDSGENIVKVTGEGEPGEQREYPFSRFDQLAVKTGDEVEAGQPLVKRHDTLWDRFGWRVKPFNLVREMLMKLDETHECINLSDGGHIENLAGIELLRRRCKFVIIGDGEADSELAFNGLATLIRYARIDLGITIEIDLDAIRVDKGTDNLSREHWAFGTITYPPADGDGQPEEGYLLYLKSSYSGDEDEVIKEYRQRNPAFPHQSTADQFFDEDQFECYRALGQHIGEKACEELSIAHSSNLSSFEKFAEAMKVRAMVTTLAAKALLDKEKEKKELKWGEDLDSYLKGVVSEATTGAHHKGNDKAGSR